MKSRAVRITAVPRTGHPNSGLQAMHFAELYDDEVWALPAPGAYLGRSPRVRFFALDKAAIKRVTSAGVVRRAFLLWTFVRVAFGPSRLYFVHSFLFAVPLYLLRRPYCIFIHGSDRRYLDSRWGKAVARRATDVFGVGFGVREGDLTVIEIPNIFIPAEDVPGSKIEHDILFVLRNAPVKNPLYPIDLAEQLGDRPGLRITVVGIAEDELPPHHRERLARLRERGCSIHYAGRKSYEQVVQLMRTSRMLLIPSHSEGVPKVLLEAMSVGLKVAVNAKLDLPPSLLARVDRLDLGDRDSIARAIQRAPAPDRSRERAEFARQYLLSSQNDLRLLYNRIYERHLGFIPGTAALDRAQGGPADSRRAGDCAMNAFDGRA